jgi:hypothetical protein
MYPLANSEAHTCHKSILIAFVFSTRTETNIKENVENIYHSCSFCEIVNTLIQYEMAGESPNSGPKNVVHC